MDEFLELRYPVPIKTLVLSGGSVKGIAILGGVQCLTDRGLLDNVTIFIGTSVGAIIAYLYILGYSPVEIMVILCQKNFLEKIVQLDMSRLFQGEKSVASFQGVQEFLEIRTVQKCQQYFTLSQLYERTGKKLVCSTYNLTQRSMEYVSPDTHPDLPCITAIRMSASLPFLFEPFTYMNSVYIDGGVCDDFPLSQIDTSIGPAFAIRVVTQIPSSKPLSDSVVDYINLLFNIFKQNMHNLSMQLYSNQCLKIFTLPINPELSMFSFSLSTTQKFNLFSNGYEHTRAQLETTEEC